MKKPIAIALLALAVLAGGGAAVLAGSDPGTALFAGIAAMWLASAAATAWKPLAGTTLAGVLGAGVSAYLVQQHHLAMAGASESVCNIDATFNCDAVNTSEFSEIAGIPVALFGAAFYAAAALIATLSWQKVRGFHNAPLILVGGGGAAVLAAIGLAIASSTLGAWCVLCISTYGLSTILLVSAVLAWRAPDDAVTKDDPGKDRSGIVAVATGALFLGLGVMGSSAETAIPGADPGDQDAGIEQLYTQVPGSIVLTGKEPCWGSPDAPYTLVEFADFECPHCGLSFPELQPLVAANPDLRVCFKNYPLSPECNPNVGRNMHPMACMAAAASLCAQDQGRFWELAGQMMANQSTLAPNDILFMAGQQGLDTDALYACMSQESTMERVAADVQAGTTAGLWATPTLFLKGVHPTEEWIQVEYGTEGVAILLAAKREGTELPPARPPEVP